MPFAFTEGRSVRQWLEHLYEPTRKALADSNLPAPSFDEFWASDGLIVLPVAQRFRHGANHVEIEGVERLGSVQAHAAGTALDP